jgi:hypothetical protein
MPLNTQDINFSHFLNLRILRLQFDSPSNGDWDPFLLLFQSLKDMGQAAGNSSPSKLKEITLIIHCVTTNPGFEVFLMDAHVWRELDALLTASSKFLDFEKFSLYIRNLPPSEWLQHQFSVPSIEKLFCGYMPGLWGKQMLDARSTAIAKAMEV